MKFLIALAIGTLWMAACLPNVARELSEVEARAMLEREVVNLCMNSVSSSRLSGILRSVEDAEAVAAKDHWEFQVVPPASDEGLEALVFPSKIVSGDYIRHVQTRNCR